MTDTTRDMKEPEIPAEVEKIGTCKETAMNIKYPSTSITCKKERRGEITTTDYTEKVLLSTSTPQKGMIDIKAVGLGMKKQMIMIEQDMNTKIEDIPNQEKLKEKQVMINQLQKGTTLVCIKAKMLILK